MVHREVGLSLKVALLLLVIGLLVPQSSGAADDLLPWEKAVPSVEEISDGRLHVGDKITKANMALVKDYLPKEMDRITADGAEWVIAKHTPSKRLLPPALIQATIKNAGSALVKADGSVYSKDGGPWVGGFPVMHPKTGVEVMANNLYADVDNSFEIATEFWVNPAGQAYKTVTAQRHLDFENGRLCVGPTPSYGRTKVYKREVLYDTAPYDVRGIAVLTFTYQDQSKLPDTWGYIPVLRRVQRFSTGQRYDSLDGSDVRAGDVNIFSDPLGLWKFKLIARKPIFGTNSEVEPSPSGPGEAIPTIKGRYPIGTRIELRDTYVVEAIPKDPSHIYSKKLLYIDAATYQMFWGNYYDRQGKLWTIGNMARKRQDSPCGNFLRIAFFNYYNLQKQSSTNIHFFHVGHSVGPKDVNREMFTLQFISTQYR